MGLQKSLMLISSVKTKQQQQQQKQIDTMSWHIATSDNEPNVHQKPFITTVALRCLATSKSTRRADCVHFFKNVIQAFFVQRLQAKF